MMQLDQIIKGCKKQNADCQKMLYQQYFSAMMNVCMRYGNSVQDAEEMLNNGFLKVFVNIQQYEGKGSFEGWMKRIMVNGCLDYLKRKENRFSKLNNIPESIENVETYFDNTLYDQGSFAELVTEQKYSYQELLKLLSTLPEPGKTIFNLVVFEEYSHKEVAAKLGIGERTSQLHYSNAKKMMAEQLVKKNIYNKVVGL